MFHDPADPEVPVASSRAIAARWPRARLIEVPDVGHRRILRSPAVIEALTDFLRST